MPQGRARNFTTRRRACSQRPETCGRSHRAHRNALGTQDGAQNGDVLIVGADGSADAQALDYASWVEHLETETISRIYQRFSKGGDLGAAFLQRFAAELDEEPLNESHQIVIVAAELDSATEGIIKYLNARDIAINDLFFQVFEHEKKLLLSRVWLIDPIEPQANVATSIKAKGDKQPWNGEYYVSYGPTSSRSWEDARRYGFISGGGGLWYSKPWTY